MDRDQDIRTPSGGGDAQQSASVDYGQVIPASVPVAPATPQPSGQLQEPVPAPALPTPPSSPLQFKKTDWKKLAKISGIIAVAFLAIGGAALVALNVFTKPKANTTADASRFSTTQIPLADFASQGNAAILGTRSLLINGPLVANDTFMISPSAQPSTANKGQIYYDKTTNQLAYFNGTQFVALGGGVQSLGGQSGVITVGNGLTSNGGQLSNSGVLTLQGQTGNVTLVAGAGVSINGTTITNTGLTSLGGQTGDITVGNGLTLAGGQLSNSGIISATGGTGISVTNDGAGNITISNTGAGSGTVNSPGGTAGRLAVFTGVQTIADSLISESGSTVTVNGSLSVTSGLTLGTALTVGNGGTGTTALANNGVVVGQGSGSLTAVTAASSGLCLLSTVGAPAFQTCPSAGGVTSLNGLSGALTLANASGSGSTVTINDASTTQKGIAIFDSNNFSSSGGLINTIQNIGTAATPTFAGVNTNSITPGGSLTVGATGQAFTLQGTAASVINATNGVSTTTLAFQSPTANVTYRFATAAAGTYDVCTMVGNCAGVGGGVTTLGGTSGTLPVFTGSQSIGNSLVSQSGSTVTVNGNLNITTGNQFQVNGTQISSANLSNDANLAKLNATQTFTGATNTFQNAANSSLAFSIQNASSQRILSINTTAGTTALGQGSTLDGQLVFNNATNSNTITIVPSAVSANRTITLPDSSGTVCLSSGNCAGAGATLQTAYNNSTTPEITLDATRGALTIRDASSPLGANLLEVQNNAGSTTYFAVTASGTSTTGTATATGTINSSGGSLQTNGTTRVDNSGNLTNIGNLTLSGAISGGTTYSGSGNINTSGGTLQTAGVSRVDNSGNLVNIGNITGTGAITIASTGAGNNVTIDGANQFVVQDAAVFNAQSTFNNSVSLALAGSQNLSITNTVTGTTSVNLVSAVLTNNTTSGTQQVALLQNAAGSGTTEGLLVLDNADGTNAVTSGLQITSAAGGVTNALDVSDPDIVTALLFGANDIVGTNLTVTGSSGSITSAGNATLQGGVVTVGTSSQAGTLVLNDGAGHTGTLQVTTLASNRTYTFPDATGTVCLTTGNCAGSGGGVTGSGTNNKLAKFTTTGSTIGDSTITDDGSNVTTSVNLIVQGGTATVGVAGSQTGTLKLADGGSSFLGSIVQGSLTGNRTYTLPDSSGTFCTTAGNCFGSGTGNTLQAAYDAGNTIATSSSRDLAITLANNSNMTVATAAGATGFTTFSLTDGSNATPPSQLVLIKNNDVNQGLATGLSIQSAAGGMTTAIDASGSNITNALKVGANAITGTTGNITYTNFNFVGSTGNLTTSGDIAVNGGDITSTGALNITPGGTLTVGVSTQTLTLAGDASTSLAATSGANTNTLAFATPSSGNHTITIPNATGTICLQSASSCGFATGSGNAFVQGGNSFAAAGDLGTNDSNALNLRTNSTTRVTIAADGSTVTLSSNTDLVLQGATAYFTNTQGQTAAESFGQGATVSGSNALAVGNGASAVGHAVAIGNAAGVTSGSFGGPVSVGDGANAGSWGVAIGQSSSDTGDHSIAIGNSASVTNDHSVAIGDSASAAQQGVAIGANSSTGGNNRIVIGYGATATADNQLVIGSSLSAISQAIIGNGVTNAAPQNFTLQATGGSGTDIVGASLTLAGGVGTGAGNGGNINLQIAKPGTTGSTPNSLSSVVTISGTNGSVLFKDVTDSSTAFQIQNAAGRNVLKVDSTAAALTLGNITATASQGIPGTVILADGTSDNFGATLNTNTLTANRTISLPDATGTVCLQSSSSCGFVLGSGTAFVQGGNSFTATANLGTNDAFALNLRTNGVTRATFDSTGSSLTLASNVSLALQGSSAHITNPQGTSQGESFGANATTSNNAVALGYNASASAADTVAIGQGTSAANQYSIALGEGAATSSTHQLVIGGSTASITQAIIGNGATSATPTAFTLQATGGSGTNIAGADINIGGGVGTGTGNGGNVNIQIAKPGTTGSTANTLSTVASISGNDGSALFKNATNGTSAFAVQNAAGNQLLTVDTSGSQVVLGKSSSITGKLVFDGSGNSNTISVVGVNSPGGNRTLTLPDETGTLCSTGSVCSGYAPASGSANYIQNTTTVQTNASFAIQSAADGNVTALLKERATQSADVLRIVDSSNVLMFNVDAFGSLHQVGTSTFTGAVGMGTNASGSSALTVQPANGSTQGIAIAVYSGQTADALQVNGNGTRELQYTGDGTLLLTGGSGQTSDIFKVQDTSSKALFEVNAGDSSVYVNGTGTNSSGGQLKFGTTGSLKISYDDTTDSNRQLDFHAEGGFKFYAGAPENQVLSVDQNGQTTVQVVSSFGGFTVKDPNGDNLTQTYGNDNAGTGTFKVGNYYNDHRTTLFVLDETDQSTDPSASDSGAMYYSFDKAGFRCFTGSVGDGNGAGEWVDCLGVPKPNTRRWAYLTYPGSGTTFDTNGDILSTTGSSSAPTLTANGATTGAPGMLDYATDSTSGHIADITGNLQYNTSNTPVYQTYAKIPTTTSVRVWLGMTDQSDLSGATPSGNFAAFRFDTASDSHYKCVQRDGTTQATPVDTGVTPNSNGNKLEIAVYPGNEVVYKIDGSVVCEMNSNRPSTSTLLRYANTVTTLSAATRSLQLGWMYIEADK